MPRILLILVVLAAMAWPFWVDLSEANEDLSPYNASTFELAVIGVGTFLGLRAKAEWDERNDLCPANRCQPEAVDAANRAQGFALAADGAFALGLVGIGVAAYLLLVPPTHAAAGRPPLSVVANGRGGHGTWQIAF